MIIPRSSGRPRRGTAAVTVVISLTVLVGIAAITVDGGMALTERRRAQAAADAAALAAAADLFANFASNGGEDPSGSARASALTTAAANGYSNDGSRSVVVVRIAPQTPLVSDATITTSGGDLKPGYAEATVQYNQPRFFSALWGTETVAIKARAVARGTWIPVPIGLILLDPSSAGALSVKGSGNLTVTGGSVIVNSSSPSGATAGGGGTLTAPEFDFAGTPGFATNGGGQFNGTLNSGVTPTADPLAYLTPPDPSKLTLQHTGGLQLTSDDAVTLNPGLYRGGIQITGKGQVTLRPGIYYMDGGGFSITGQGALVGDGVLIYNAPATSGDTITLAGQGSMTLTPMTTSAYQGITLFQDRTSAASIKVTGNGSLNITGTVYAPGSTLDVTGNGSTDVIGSQYIGYDMSLTGNGNVTIHANGPAARTRKIGLVE
jgi:Flp pilus assembly protein TadG